MGVTSAGVVNVSDVGAGLERPVVTHAGVAGEQPAAHGRCRVGRVVGERRRRARSGGFLGGEPAARLQVAHQLRRRRRPLRQPSPGVRAGHVHLDRRPACSRLPHHVLVEPLQVAPDDATGPLGADLQVRPGADRQADVDAAAVEDLVLRHRLGEEQVLPAAHQPERDGDALERVTRLEAIPERIGLVGARQPRAETTAPGAAARASRRPPAAGRRTPAPGAAWS